jgi:hypothetical protein
LTGRSLSFKGLAAVGNAISALTDTGDKGNTHSQISELQLNALNALPQRT